MQATHLIFRTSQRLWARHARQLAAKLFDGTNQPSLFKALFHYQDTSGGELVPAQGYAPVRFADAASGFALVGFGSEGSNIVNDAGPLLASLLSKHTNTAVHLEQREIGVAIERRPYHLRYSIPRVVVQKKLRHLEILKSPETGRVHVERLLTRSISDQAQFLGIEVPDDIELRLVGSEGEFRAELGHGNASLLGMKGLTFEVKASLSGLWGFGYIQTQGYGLLNANLAKAGRP